VRAVVPSEGAPDNQITTGPDKTTTATEAEARQRVEALRRAFVGSVLAERNTSLSESELSYAKVYSGTTGVELGLADEVGGLDAAISAAAEEAGLSDYETVRMESPTASPLSQIGLNASGDATVDVDTTQYFMLHGQLDVSDAAAQMEVTTNGTN
jgi:protease-4